MWQNKMHYFNEYFPWFLALHVMAFISWMAGMFYLPRLFVYHTQIKHDDEYARFCLMEKRLLRQIMTPAACITFITGSLMASLPHIIDWHALWWWGKILCLVGMFAFHGLCARWCRAFAQKRNKHTEKFYRFANEVPTILMMIIVIMIIVRPG